MNRRTFLAAAAATTAAAKPAKLAVEGGTPVRQTPLKADFFGTQYYGEEETRELNDVVKTRRPFRWYGPGNEPPMKVATFEKELAQRMQTRYALKDLVGRLAFAGIAINASLALTGQMITLANALAAGFLGDGASAAGGASSLQTFIVGALAGGGIFITFLGLACAAVAVVLLVLYLIRAAIVVVLICAAPLMLLCHLFPQSEGLAHLWWRAMAAAFGIQIAQALVLAAAVRVFFTSDGGSGLGLSVTGAVINMLICLCLLFVLVKIPFWAKQLAFGRGGSSSTMRLVKHVVAVRTGIPRAVL